VTKQPLSAEQKQLRTAAGMLAAAVVGLATAVISGLALVPRVRLVEVLSVVAGGVGGGAALVGAIIQFKHARAAARRRR
jgi:Na+/citrate or Na+/malate symporter